MTRKRTLSSVVLLMTVFSAAGGLCGQEIKVDASQVVGRVSRHLTGACIEDVNHEIYGGIYSQMIFGESFQEPPLAPVIAGFKTHGGRWLVRDGVVSIRAADGPKLVSERGAFKDGAIGVEMKFDDRKGTNAGLIVRVNKPRVGADRFVGYEIALDPGRQRLLLARHRDNFEPIKDVACEVAVGRWITLEVRLSGSVIEIFVDQKSLLRHDDGEQALPAGAVGLRGWQREVSYRKLWVKTGEESETLAFKQAEEITEVSGMWRPLRRGAAQGSFALSSDRPFAGTQSQQVVFMSGEGEWGVENQGLNRRGMSFVEGQAYEGYVWVRADKAASLVVLLESRDGTRTYGETKLNVIGNDWQRLDFTLTPNAADEAGRFAVKLKQPGSVVLGHVFLQPGEWGRFKGLPVRGDVAKGLIDQGITVLRYGGSMVNNGGYKWKKMIGPRDRRPPYAGTWYRYSSNGWGILDFMDFCEAAGFEYVPAFNMDETPRDLADFIEYAKGAADSEWGRKRVADGHAQPYKLRYLELGNEEKVDETYAAKFEALAKAIWAKDRDLILVVGDFVYGKPIHDPMKFTGAASGITNLTGHRQILALARANRREVWFDIHISTDGPGPSGDLMALPTYIDALAKAADGAKHKVVVFEFNSGNHAVRRALGNALATNVIERDGRIPIVTSANCLQPDRQNDNGWDQGLLFLNPTQVWLQPPGYVTQMFSRSYLPEVVKCEATGAKDKLDVTAKRSEDGTTLVLQVVNVGEKEIATQLQIAGFTAGNSVAQVIEISGPLDASNSANKTNAIIPKQSQWTHEMKEGKARYTFPPNSFTIIRWQGRATK
jgi:Alpha-L-arabinofuranosidase C-terminal domain/Domain of Unknown Function (DUF1080)